MASLQRIWVKRFKGGPMDRVGSAEVVEQSGIVGNANRGGKRQITVIDADRWAECVGRLPGELEPAESRRANLMIQGLELENTRGRRLVIGDCVLKINGETVPCNLMEETREGLQAALAPRWAGGIFCEVLQGGTIREGQACHFEEPSD